MTKSTLGWSEGIPFRGRAFEATREARYHRSRRNAKRPTRSLEK